MRFKLCRRYDNSDVVRDPQTGHPVGYAHFQKPYATPASAPASNVWAYSDGPSRATRVRRFPRRLSSAPTSVLSLCWGLIISHPDSILICSLHLPLHLHLYLFSKARLCLFYHRDGRVFRPCWLSGTSRMHEYNLHACSPHPLPILERVVQPGACSPVSGSLSALASWRMVSASSRSLGLLPP